VYEEIVARERDPALLEWKEPTRHGERLQLRVFPVREGAPARVTIDLVFPPAERLRFDVGPTPVALSVDNDGDVDKQPAAHDVQVLAIQHTRDLVDLETGPAERPRVDRWTSLVAGVPWIDRGSQDYMRRPEMIWPGTPRIKGGPLVPVFKGDVLDELIAASAAHLSHCYAYGVARDPRLGGRGELVLRIDPDGSVREAGVNGDVAEDSEVRWCIADEALHWKLPGVDASYTIRRPLDLHANP
jgi:hypothetical protein